MTAAVHVFKLNKAKASNQTKAAKPVIAPPVATRAVPLRKERQLTKPKEDTDDDWKEF